VLVINAGSADGQFSLVFTHTSVQGTEVKAVKTIKVGKIVPDCISDPTTCPTKAACEQTLSVFTDDGCELADARDPADTTQPTYPTNEDDAKFAAGTLNKTAKGTKFEASVTIGTHDIVQVASAIKVDKDDIGKKADILVAGLNLFPPGSTMVPPWSYFMLRGCGPVEIANNTCPSVGWVVELWPQNSDGQVSIAGLKPFQSVDALQEYQTLYVYTGNLDLPVGTELWLYYGYMITQAGIDQGKLVFNKVPMEITIK
jgi:hypothetical protein